MLGPHGVNRVVVVDDHVLFAEALDVALRIEGYDVDRVDVDDRSMSSGQLLSRILRLRPGMVLLDLELGRGGDTTDLVQPLTQAGVAVVIVTASTDRLRWGECLRYGARAVLPKSAPLVSIRDTLRLIAEGRPLPGRQEREQLVADFHRQNARRVEIRGRLDRLSCREREVLGHLMAGRPVREIAQRSYVSEATVRTQVKSILAKLEVTSQLAAVGAAHETDWRPPVAVDQR
ncbi:MAG TPA: response regulator transcription factor [Nocardioides sp.]|nr:response regulator transcription factor [Nocardioides sp.]